MSDLGATTWTEVDANNNATPPNGWPEGMNPSDVNNAARAEMGGEKRFWVRTNSVFTTAGTTTAYTLTYGQAAAAYYDGEEFSIIINATCGAAPTLNINGLGARQIRKFVGGSYINAGVGDLLANQPIRVRYNLSATTFDILGGAPSPGLTGWQLFQAQSPSAAAAVDFITIPATVNHLQCFYDFKPSADGAIFELQTYGADGVLDTGATDYYWATQVWNTASSPSNGAATGAVIALSGGVDNGNTGVGGDFASSNIQAATFTKFNYRSNYLDTAGTNGIGVAGFGARSEADRITGFRILVNGGTFTGKVSLYVST